MGLISTEDGLISIHLQKQDSQHILGPWEFKMASDRTIELLIVISAKLIMVLNRTTNLLCLKTK